MRKLSSEMKSAKKGGSVQVHVPRSDKTITPFVRVA